MAMQPWPVELGHIEAPRVDPAFSDVLNQVATEGKPVIVCRDGLDLAAVVSLEHLELLREVLERIEVEKLAASMNWRPILEKHTPPQSWFDDETNPFEPEDPVP